MHEAALAQAALPAPTVVLGLLLRPYSLGHELFLIREGNCVGNAVASIGGKPPEMRDLVEAVLICCQTFAEAKAMNRDWFFELKMKLWGRRLKKVDVAVELGKFRAYLDQGSLEFPISRMPRPGVRTSGRMAGAPFLLRLHQFLVTRLGLNEAAAWDYPYGLAKMQWSAYWEAEGGLDLYNEHEEQFDAFVAAQEALLPGRHPHAGGQCAFGAGTAKEEVACPV